MPLGKIKGDAGKGADYSAGSLNIEAQTAQKEVLKSDNLKYGKGVGGSSSVGADSLEIQNRTEAQKVAAEAKAV